MNKPVLLVFPSIRQTVNMDSRDVLMHLDKCGNMTVHKPKRLTENQHDLLRSAARVLDLPIGK